MPSPGLNRALRTEQALAGAEALGVALSGVADPALALKPEDRAAALLVHRLAGDCRNARMEWVNAVARVARVTVPYVDARDVAPLFEKVRGAECMKSQDELGRRRIAVLEAINAGDAAALSHHATWTLLRLPPQLDSERPFYIMAALAGAVASGSWNHANALAKHHVPRLPRRDREGPLVQLLLGHLRKAAAP
jgi:hypothetical protein